MVKQKFYVIAHNPNTVSGAREFLRAGANALGPDIRYDAGRYYISHEKESLNPLTTKPNLADYLTGLRSLIIDSPELNLAMIFFDIKEPVFDINEFLQIVYKYFAQFPVCNEVAVMVTIADLKNAGFLLKYDQSVNNVGIGVDQHSNPLEVHDVFKNSGQHHTAYADGITGKLTKPGLFYSISEAKFLQRQGDSFQMVFTWVLAKKSSMRSFLQLYPDGIIVDLEMVDPLLNILSEPEYAVKFELAVNGHNPWTAPLPPSYLLSVKTRNKILAGTDSDIRFKLTGSTGTLETTIDTSFDGMMEKNSLNHVVLQGENIGTIENLSIELLDTGIAAGWLPESILIESKLHKSMLFTFHEDEWLYPHGPLIKS